MVRFDLKIMLSVTQKSTINHLLCQLMVNEWMSWNVWCVINRTASAKKKVKFLQRFI